MGASFPQLSDCTRAAVVQLHRQYTHSRAVGRSENPRGVGNSYKVGMICSHPDRDKVKYSEKATKVCEIFTLLLSYIVPVKSKAKILQNFVAFSEYMNFKLICQNLVGHAPRLRQPCRVVVVRVVLAFQLFSWRQTKTTAKAAAGPRAVDVTNFWQILFCGKQQWRRRRQRRRRLPGSSNSVEWGSGLQLHALKAMCRFPLSSSFLQESSVRFSNYYRPSPAKGCSQFRSAYDKVDWFEEGCISDVLF